jgi:hypothetical protein
MIPAWRLATENEKTSPKHPFSEGIKAGKSFDITDFRCIFAATFKRKNIGM